MARHERAAVVEALLFASDEPLSLTSFRKVLEDLSPGEIREILDALKQEYEEADRGVSLLEVAGGFVLCTRESCAPWVEKLMKGKRRIRLSRAALETVAVVAYKQPIARSEIERIRGVDAGGVLATLLERDLILIKGRDSGPGKPLLYGTTQEFLNYFGLNRLSDLPRLDELSVLAARRPAWSEAERARFEKAGVEAGAPEDEPEAVAEAGAPEDEPEAVAEAGAPEDEPEAVAEAGPPGRDAPGDVEAAAPEDEFPDAPGTLPDETAPNGV